MYKFRGKDYETKEWYYGGIDSAGECISVSIGRERYIAVDEKTIGQYTGLKDKNNTEIYEGDILKVYNCKTKEFEFGEVVMSGLGIWSIVIENLKVPIFEFIDCKLSLVHDMNRIEIIGNVYENPEN